MNYNSLGVFLTSYYYESSKKYRGRSGAVALWTYL